VSAPTTPCRGRRPGFWYGVDNPIDLLGNNDSSASEAEVDDSGLRAKGAAPAADLCDNSETVDVSAPAPRFPNTPTARGEF
jgi:hypothetical protein